jgi:signal transduction histidine kinase
MTADRPRSTVRAVTAVRDLVRRHGDVLLAAGMVALAQVEFWTASGLTLGQRLLLAGTSVAAGAAYAVRSRVPLAAGIAMLVLALLEGRLPEAHGGEWIGLFVLVGVYTVAAHTSGRQAVVAAGLTAATGLVVLVSDPDAVDLGGLLFFGFLFATPWFAGRAIRRRRLREAQLEKEKLAAESAIAEERTRIARELHDVVAHAISVIVLQARGGRKLLDEEPSETRQALDAIERTATQALGEMRRLLGLLREGDAELALAPQPTLARLDELVAEVRDAGLPVELAVEGQPAELPPGVDLSAYRIVQEALTNALRHAGPATARVTVRYGEGELDVEVSDDGVGSENGSEVGHGLTGIRERVAVFGGDVQAGARPEGGYALRARLPYSSER